jgi:hypothetical protein
MNAIRRQFVQWTVLLASGAGLLQFGGCFENVGVFANNFNPCGVVLNCDPTTYEFATSGYDGPGFDPDVDLTCTYPPFCGTTPVPAQ